jgi:hypothetical protein
VEILAQLFGLLIPCGIALLALSACWQLWRTAREASSLERALIGAGLLGLAAVVWIPASTAGRLTDTPMTIFITAAWVAWVARGAAVAPFIALAVISRRRGRRRGLQAGLLAVFVFAPVAECGRFAANLSPWQQYGTLEHQSGTRYAYVESSFMQGQLLTIARVQAEHWYGTDYTKLVLTHGDWPRAYISLVRPDTSDAPGYGQLYVAPDGRVIAVRSENHAYMALDPKTGEEWSHESIYSLSPFILLDAQARPSADDIALTEGLISSVCQMFEEHETVPPSMRDGATLSGIPMRRVLRADAADHPNPTVRTLAEQLLVKLRAQPCLGAERAAAPDQN